MDFTLKYMNKFKLLYYCNDVPLFNFDSKSNYYWHSALHTEHTEDFYCKLRRIEIKIHGFVSLSRKIFFSTFSWDLKKKKKKKKSSQDDYHEHVDWLCKYI